ncbi:hypothetical protein FQN60_000054, partial [Etheostoma spectabile]
MKAAGEVEQVETGGPSHPVDGLSRCAACYKQQTSSMHRWGDGDESSSSDEGSGPEVDLDSEAESSSSSSSNGDGADAESGDKDGDGPDEASPSQEGKTGTKRPRRLVKSFSLPPSFAPLALQPRPQTVVSTLHLQVVSQDHGDGVYIVKQEPAGRGGEETGQSHGGLEGTDGGRPRSQQTGLSRQQGSHPPSQQHWLPHRQQHLQQVSPLSDQGQRGPPPLHTDAPHPPYRSLMQTHVQGPSPQPCWYC